MDPERKQALKVIQETAIDHAIEEMGAADEFGVDETTDRKNRGFLTGMASKSLAVAVRIEQFMILLERPKSATDDDDESEYQAANNLIRGARAEVKSILERSRAGAKSHDD